MENKPKILEILKNWNNIPSRKKDGIIAEYVYGWRWYVSKDKLQCLFPPRNSGWRFVNFFPDFKESKRDKYPLYADWDEGGQHEKTGKKLLFYSSKIEDAAICLHDLKDLGVSFALMNEGRDGCLFGFNLDLPKELRECFPENNHSQDLPDLICKHILLYCYIKGGIPIKYIMAGD